MGFLPMLQSSCTVWRFSLCWSIWGDWKTYKDIYVCNGPLKTKPYFKFGAWSRHRACLSHTYVAYENSISHILHWLLHHHRWSWFAISHGHQCLRSGLCYDTVNCYLYKIAASPPRYVTFEQLMSAADGIKKMTIAHEIAVNDEFELPKEEPPQNRYILLS